MLLPDTNTFKLYVGKQIGFSKLFFYYTYTYCCYYILSQLNTPIYKGKKIRQPDAKSGTAFAILPKTHDF